MNTQLLPRLGLLGVLLVFDPCRVHADTNTSPVTSSGMIVSQNLSGMCDWNTGQPFINVFKYMRTWQSANAVDMGANGWATGLDQYITTDGKGWPTQVPFIAPNVYDGEPDPNNIGCFLSAQQVVHSIVSVVIPGSYRLRFRGTGTFILGGTGSTCRWCQTFGPADIAALPVDSDGKYYFDTPSVYTPPDGNNVPIGSLDITINSSSGTNYLRDFELLSPGYTNCDYQHPFTPQFLATLQGFNTLRMMDWGGINNSPLISWTNRTLPTAYTQSQLNGVALEYMILICNQMNENLWLNIPHQANEDYVQKAALLILNGAKADGTPFYPGVDAPSLRVWPALNPSLKVYLEYSNETWNYSFQQAAYVVAQGVALRDQQGLPFDPDNYTAGEQYAAFQSANIWEWFYEEWGTNAPQRLIRVMGGSMIPYLSNVRMNAFQIPGLITENQFPDVLAIAPYFGSSVADNLVSSGQLATVTTAQILQQAENDMTNNVLPEVAANKAVAAQYGVPLSCYEGGQGLVGSWANTSNTNLTAQLIAANHDPGMGNLYSVYLAGLSSNGVVEIANFSHIGESSQYGSWDIMENLTQPVSTAYKYQALLSWISNNPLSATTVAPTLNVTYASPIIDTTGTGAVAVPLSASNSVDYFGNIVSFSWGINGTNYTGVNITPTLPVGMNTVIVTATNNRGVSSSKSIQIMVRPQGSDTVLVQSDFTGTAPGQNMPWTNTSILSPGVSFGGWTYIPFNFTPPGWIFAPIGILASSSDNNAFGVYLGGQATPATLQEAVTYNQYLSCTITPNPGQSLDLRGAYVKWTMANITGQAEEYCALATSITGFNASSMIFTSPQYNTSDHWSGPELDTFGTYLPMTADYANVTGPVEIRIYLYGNYYWYKPTDLVGFQMTGVVK